MQVKLTRIPGVGRQTQFRAEVSRPGADLPRKPQMTAAEQHELKPGTRGLVPKGLDTDTPGFTGSRRTRTVFSRR